MSPAAAGKSSRESNENVRRLVDRAQQGDRDALEELYLIHFDRIYGYLHMSVGNRHDVVDGDLLGRRLDVEDDQRAWFVGELIHGVGIDQQSVGEFLGGAGEARQHQHARIFGILRRDVFLGDEVHAVAHRRDQADVARAVERRQRPP